MARFGKDYKAALQNARANANAEGSAWAVFCDTSGAWNSERWRETMTPTQNWAGVTYEKILPDKDEETGMTEDERNHIG